MIDQTTATRFVDLMPLQESVTFYSRGTDDSFTAYTINQAHRRDIDKERFEDDGRIFSKAELEWEFYASVLLTVSCPAPKIGDYLIDGNSVQYNVTDVKVEYMGGIFTLTTNQQVP